MAEHEVTSAALSLGRWLVQALRFVGDVKDKVGELENGRIELEAYLECAGKKIPPQNVVVSKMLSQGREMVFDCEDVILKYELQVAHHEYEEGEGCQLGSIMRWVYILTNNPVRLYQIRPKIDGLIVKMDNLRRRMCDFGIRPGEVPADTDHRCTEQTRIHAHDRGEYQAIGVEHHLHQLVHRLVYSHQTVIAISGMGCIGKSRLAKELYHNDEVKKHFQYIAMAHLSRQFEPDRILRRLLKRLVPLENELRIRTIEKDIEAGQAHEALYEFMREFKCLVIIDDIWTSSDWANLEKGFHMTATGSKILLTTRNGEAVSCLDQHIVYLHSIEGLNDDSSWDLFEKAAFPGAKCPDPKKVELSQKMLKHCRGVPLAIIELGKALQRAERVKEWEQMCEDISKKIEEGNAYRNASDEMHHIPYKKVYDALRVSYDAMQPYLQKCFRHLAKFPKDYEIPAEILLQLWDSDLTLRRHVLREDDLMRRPPEDAAEKCLNMLVSRNMVQVATRDWLTGRIETCRLHVLMRDICIGIAKDEDFLQIINCQKPLLLANHTNGNHPFITKLPKSDRKRLRHLAVYVAGQGQSSTLPPTAPSWASTNVSGARKLRSLSLFTMAEHPIEEDSKRFLKAIFKQFQRLEVFYCENFIIKGKLPKEIGKLSTLRYLNLANSGITKLPSSIDKLKLLETLDLRVNKDTVISLPNVLWKIKQLKHLYLPYFGGLEILEQGGVENFPQRYLIQKGELLRLDGLQNLQTILHLDLDRVDSRGLSELRSMKRLSAICVTKEALRPFLQLPNIKIESLRVDVKIINEDPNILSSCGAMDELVILAQPNAGFALSKPLCLEMFPERLLRLGIWYLELYTDPLPILERLPDLAGLDLRMCYSGSRMACTAQNFPRLTQLSFDGLINFKDWKVEEGALPKLQRLEIINCPLPKVPRALPSSVDANMLGRKTASGEGGGAEAEQGILVGRS